MYLYLHPKAPKKKKSERRVEKTNDTNFSLSLLSSPPRPNLCFPKSSDESLPHSLLLLSSLHEFVFGWRVSRHSSSSSSSRHFTPLPGSPISFLSSSSSSSSSSSPLPPPGKKVTRKWERKKRKKGRRKREISFNKKEMRVKKIRSKSWLFIMTKYSDTLIYVVNCNKVNM